jgi:hypothetical protein
MYARIREIYDGITATLYELLLLDMEELFYARYSITRDRERDTSICRYDLIVEYDNSIVLSDMVSLDDHDR